MKLTDTILIVAIAMALSCILPFAAVGQTYVSSTGRISDGSLIARGMQPDLAFRMADGTWIFHSRGRRHTYYYQAQLVRFNPKDSSFRYLETQEPPYSGTSQSNGDDLHRGTFIDSVYVSIVPDSLEGWSEFGSVVAHAIRYEHLGTGAVTRYRPTLPDGEANHFWSIFGGINGVLVNSRTNIWYVDSSQNWTPLLDAPSKYYDPAFFLYSDGEHILALRQVAQTLYASTDGGASWDQLDFNIPVNHACQDAVTGTWYCFNDSTIFTVDSLFRLTPIRSVDLSYFDRIQAHNGTIALRKMLEDDESSRTHRRVYWNTGDSTTFGFTQARHNWGEVAFSDSGRTVFYGNRLTVASINAVGLEDTLSTINAHTSFDSDLQSTSDSSWLSPGLRASVNRHNWKPHTQQGAAVQRFRVYGEFAFGIHREGKLFSSIDSGRTFTPVQSDIDSALWIEHVLSDTFIVYDSTELQFVDQRGAFDRHYEIDSGMIRKVATSAQGSVAVLTETISHPKRFVELMSIENGRLTTIPVPKNMTPVHDVEFDSTGVVWITTRLGPFTWSAETNEWTSRRLGAAILARTSGIHRTWKGHLMLQTGDEFLYVFDQVNNRWKAVYMEGEGAFRGDYRRFDRNMVYTHTGGGYYTIRAPQRRAQPPSWVPDGLLERCTWLDNYNAYGLSVSDDGPPTVVSRDAHYTLSRDLENVQSTLPVDDIGSPQYSYRTQTVHGFSKDSSSPGYVVYDTNGDTTISVSSPDSDVELNATFGRAFGFDSVIVNYTRRQGRRDLVNIYRGVVDPIHIMTDSIESSRLGVCSTSQNTIGFVSYLQDGGAGQPYTYAFVISSANGHRDTLAIENNAFYHEGVVAGRFFAFAVRNEDRSETVYMYDLRSLQLVGRHTTTMTNGRLDRFPSIQFLSGGRYLLMQADSLVLLESSSMEVIDAIEAEGHEFRTPVAYEQWVMGISNRNLYRWHVAGTPLSANDDPILTNERPFNVHIAGGFLVITDQHQKVDHYELYSLDGHLISSSTVPRFSLQHVASGSYIVVRLASDDTAPVSQPVQIVK